MFTTYLTMQFYIIITIFIRNRANDTEVCGTFELPVLAKLTDKEQQFVIDFIKSSGSLKDMAKNMGVSYPTVRNILDDLIDKLNKIE